MSIWSTLATLFRGKGRRRESETEPQLRSAGEEKRGSSGGKAQAKQAPVVGWREHSDRLKLAAWLDAVRSDLVFGWRQLKKKPVNSAVAMLSLGLALGACTTAFRLIDALLLRPLPVENAARLYLITHHGHGPGGDFRVSDSSEYPPFLLMRDAVRPSAELIAASYADRVDVTYGSDEQMEKANRQYVSGRMFREFGILPVAGRVLTESDDQTPGAHPYAVLSHEYWTRRFGQDPRVVGKSVRVGDVPYEIVGVAAPPFMGTEPGTAVDLFVPTMMNPYVTRSDASWFRPLIVLRPGVDPNSVQAKLRVISRAFQQSRVKEFRNQSKQFVERFLNQTLLLEPAPSGASGLQRDYQRPLLVLGVFAALLLLIACANIANLMLAQTAARAEEMALRVSIGASGRQLAQLVLAESLWLGLLSTVAGQALAWWITPVLVSRINPPDSPASLLLSADWRVVLFGASLAIGVTFLFGLIPAVRASSARPVSALRGGSDARARSRAMYALIALQTAFCLAVLFAASLLAASLDHLTNQPLGFSPQRLLALDVNSTRPQPAEVWEEAAAQLRAVPGVESVALASWPLLSGNGSNGTIRVNGEPTEVLSYFLGVSPEWRSTMGITLLEGRDFRAGESSPGVALVNEAFVKQCFGGVNPLGKSFERGNQSGSRFEVIGIVRDARYRNLREPLTPTAYIPIPAISPDGKPQPLLAGAFLVRTSIADPLSLAAVVRREVPRARPELRVSNVRTQAELVRRHSVRERLLTMLSLFFAGATLLLGAAGLHGVLNYSVVQRRREIGIRLAVGASTGDIVRRVAGRAVMMVLLGAGPGVLLGVVLGRFAASLLYGVRSNDMRLLAIPALALFSTVLLAIWPAVSRASRIDPAPLLRPE